jgi:hypothetical protein
VLHGFKAMGSFAALGGGLDGTSARAAALYKALGTKVADAEYTLGVLPDGRWALVGLPIEGQRYAVEER